MDDNITRIHVGSWTAFEYGQSQYRVCTMQAEQPHSHEVPDALPPRLDFDDGCSFEFRVAEWKAPDA